MPVFPCRSLKQLPPEQLDFAGLLDHTPLPWPDGRKAPRIADGNP